MIVESIVRDNLSQHLIDEGLLHESQHEFVPKKSCTTQLMEVMEDWRTAVEHGEPVGVLYLDSPRPSTCSAVSHLRLTSKLGGYVVLGASS